MLVRFWVVVAGLVVVVAAPVEVCVVVEVSAAFVVVGPDCGATFPPQAARASVPSTTVVATVRLVIAGLTTFPRTIDGAGCHDGAFFDILRADR